MSIFKDSGIGSPAHYVYVVINVETRYNDRKIIAVYEDEEEASVRSETEIRERGIWFSYVERVAFHSKTKS